MERPSFAAGDRVVHVQEVRVAEPGTAQRRSCRNTTWCNEALAALMRRFGICEERGSGVDKIVFQAEVFQLPAPIFEVVGEAATRVVLLAPTPLSRMDREDRVRACYQHACLKYVSMEFLTNASVRQRFGIQSKSAAQASRFIKEAVEAGLIRVYDAAAAQKARKYVPYWAKASEPPPST